MATSLTAVKRLVSAFSTSTVTSNTVVKGAINTITQAFAGVLNVRYGRTNSNSLGATVFRLEGIADASALGAGLNSKWVPIYMWTTALHGGPSVQHSLLSTAAAGALQIQVSAAPTSAASAPIFIYNSAAPATSEWNYVAGSASITQSLLNSLDNAQTAATAILTSQAEMWSIPVDLSGYVGVRLVIDNLANAVAQSVVVSAEILLMDAVAGT